VATPPWYEHGIIVSDQRAGVLPMYDPIEDGFDVHCVHELHFERVGDVDRFLNVCEIIFYFFFSFFFFVKIGFS
jgi:hypothetical protein